jgi:GH25 family lysozyme M1 (1,4-beta-N-acetylmuramidase)
LNSALGAAAVSVILLPITTGLAAQWLYNIARFNPFRDALFTGCVVLVMTVLAVSRGAHVPARKRLRHAAVKSGLRVGDRRRVSFHYMRGQHQRGNMTEPESAHGINLSHREIVDDWNAVRHGDVRFASVTVTENTNWSDLSAERHLVHAQEAGIHAGARHYARPGAVHDQAEHFVRTASKLGAFSPGSLAPTLEVAAASVDDKFIKAWIKAVRHAARVQRVMVYADHDCWARRLHPDKWADSEVTLWLIRHNGIPGRPGWFHSRLGVHQHGNDASVPGIRGPVGQDAVVYPFTLADLLL